MSVGEPGSGMLPDSGGFYVGVGMGERCAEPFGGTAAVERMEGLYFAFRLLLAVSGASAQHTALVGLHWLVNVKTAPVLS